MGDMWQANDQVLLFAAELQIYKKNCAHDWIRTSTPFPAPPPQDGKSTNFSTWATGKEHFRSLDGVQKYIFLFSPAKKRGSIS
jgi:hypothetical protein